LNNQIRRFPAVFTVAPLMLALSLPLTATAATPTAATQQGYTVNTFSSNFTAQTVDINGTLNRGFKWYLGDLFSYRASPAGVKINSDGSVTLLGDHTYAAGALMSVAPYRGTNTFVGTAFGGGAYIEAVLSYNPAQVTAWHTGASYPWPAFWSLPMEGNLIPGAAQWPGQAAGYLHSVEVDFFEADNPTDPKRYGVAMHEWWGITNETCPGLCKITPNPPGVLLPPIGTDFTQYHTYGFMWVAATATTPGFVEAYFDGRPTGYKVSWSRYTNQPPTPVGQPWAYGRADQQHLFFILGTGEGEPMNVKSVNVWQTDASKNMSN
jgi:hypothetical protein